MTSRNDPPALNRITAAQFKSALSAVHREGLSRAQLALLQAHYRAPKRTASWRELAPAAGFASAEPVKLHYGNLAKRVAGRLGISAPPMGFWLHVLADWGPSEDSAGHTTFRLRPAVVRALAGLSLFPGHRRSGGATQVVRPLHIVQGGADNGDKASLDRNAGRRGRAKYTPWVVPKSAKVGDAVVVYVRGYGFYATATIDTVPAARRDWARRYGAHLRDVRRIEPPLSLGVIRKSLPDWLWANYPRSITTPSPLMAQRISSLVKRRTATRLPDTAPEALPTLSVPELRALAYARGKEVLTPVQRQQWQRTRTEAVRRYVLAQADGQCEGCTSQAPFVRADGSPYLEPHHIDRVGDDGPDLPHRVAAVCPNCHQRAHHARDRHRFNALLRRRVAERERRNGRP